MFKIILRPVYNGVLDANDWLARFRQGKLHYPPRKLRDVGGDDLADFEKTGKEFVGYFRELCGLQPSEHVLEIGSGSGRIALALAEYLAGKGSYAGVEVTHPSVEWSKENITSRYPNFKFLHADLYNKRYNPGATLSAKDYIFPFAAECFDFVFLTSVFTHSLPEDTEHYVSEISRMLKPGGRGLLTFFLLNAEQGAMADQGRNQISFFPAGDNYQVRDRQVPESAVAYEEAYILQVLEGKQLAVTNSIHYGAWSGREGGLSFQDIMVVTKNSN